MAWTDEQRREAIGQIPIDTHLKPKPNAFGDAAASSASPRVAQVPGCFFVARVRFKIGLYVD